MLDRALLLLPLGHADLSRRRPAAHRALCRLPTPVPTSFCYCNQRSALHSQEFPSVRPSALSGWGVHSFILVKEKISLFNISKTFVVTLKNVLMVYFSQGHSDEMYIYQLRFS